MATLLKGKDAQRNPVTGLELGICPATISNTFTRRWANSIPGWTSRFLSWFRARRGPPRKTRLPASSRRRYWHRLNGCR